MTVVGVHPAWADAMVLFAVAQRVRKRAEGTIDVRARHLARFAGDVRVSPWHVENETIHAWLLARVEGGWSEQTARLHHSTLRAFYRWAWESQRVAVDPALEPDRRARRTEPPPAWRQELIAFKVHLRGIGRSQETIRTRIDAVRRFALENPRLGPWDVSLDDLFDWFGGKRWAAETRKLHRDALIGFYRWAVDTERTTRNPAAKLPPIHGAAPSPRPVQDDVYAVAIAKADRRERLALRLAAEVGLRRGEVAIAHARDLEQDGQGDWWLHVHGKGGKPRRVPLPESLAGLCRAQPPGYLFPGAIRGHISAGTLGKLISDLMPPGVTMHALRHRFASRVYGVDRDLMTVQQLLGHASPATTQRYVAVSASSMRRLVESAAD